MEHSFHIPVLGIGYSADTPLKVAPLGIDSVISLVDDILLEKLRKMYCGQNALHYEAISDKDHDFRAKRITAYLNLFLLGELQGKPTVLIHGGGGGVATSAIQLTKALSPETTIIVTEGDEQKT